MSNKVIWVNIGFGRRRFFQAILMAPMSSEAAMALSAIQLVLNENQDS